MKIPVLERLMFSEPSIWVTATTVVTLISMVCLCFSELYGNHPQYSKFTNNNKPSATSAKQGIKLSSKSGMLIVYTPAFIAGAVSFVVFPSGDLRFFLLKFVVTFHFFKRDLEVLFVHKYSGGMIFGSIISITLFYFSVVAGLISIQYLSLGLPDPSIDTKYIGLILFILGISGNFYHHTLLSKLRNNNEKEYKIPRGGLFDLVICPHYLFESITFIGISFISQTPFAFACTFGDSMYLIVSYATRKWYVNKFEDFPKDVKCVIPYIF